VCDVGRASVLVRVKLFSLVFVRTHRLVSEGKREKERDREMRRERGETRGRESDREWKRGERRRRGKGARGKKDRA